MTILAPFGAVLVIVGLILFRVWPYLLNHEPEEIRIFREHRPDFVTFARGGDVESVRTRLHAAGVKNCRKDGELVVFVFPFIAIDSVPQIYYSPSGRDGLPKGFWTGGEPMNRFFDPRDLGDNWFYCRWDQ